MHLQPVCQLAGVCVCLTGSGGPHRMSGGWLTIGWGMRVWKTVFSKDDYHNISCLMCTFYSGTLQFLLPLESGKNFVTALTTRIGQK